MCNVSNVEKRHRYILTYVYASIDLYTAAFPLDTAIYYRYMWDLKLIIYKNDQNLI